MLTSLLLLNAVHVLSSPHAASSLAPLLSAGQAPKDPWSDQAFGRLATIRRVDDMLAKARVWPQRRPQIKTPALADLFTYLGMLQSIPIVLTCKGKSLDPGERYKSSMHGLALVRPCGAMVQSCLDQHPGIQGYQPTLHT